jgi:hypothetical protein
MDKYLPANDEYILNIKLNHRLDALQPVCTAVWLLKYV